MERYIVGPIEDYDGPGRVDPLTGFIEGPKAPDADTAPTADPEIDRLTGLPKTKLGRTALAGDETQIRRVPEGYDPVTGYFRDGRSYV